MVVRSPTHFEVILLGRNSSLFSVRHEVSHFALFRRGFPLTGNRVRDSDWLRGKDLADEKVNTFYEICEHYAREIQARYFGEWFDPRPQPPIPNLPPLPETFTPEDIEGLLRLCHRSH